MSHSAHRSSDPPAPPLYDAVLDDERSAIRPRSPRPPEEPPAELGDRIERKVRLGVLLQNSLPPGDPRARLLRVAIVRRDETLLDALLRELRPDAGAAPGDTKGRADTLPPHPRPAASGRERRPTLLPPPPSSKKR